VFVSNRVGGANCSIVEGATGGKSVEGKVWCGWYVMELRR
jgi:hypothetical protein